MRYEITAISLEGEPLLQHITLIHGLFGQKTRAQGVADIESGTNSFYTRARGLIGLHIEGETPVEVVDAPSGLLGLNALMIRSPYLRSQPNALKQDNLLSLPRI